MQRPDLDALRARAEAERAQAPDGPHTQLAAAFDAVLALRPRTLEGTRGARELLEQLCAFARAEGL